jgi:hypothetical protein
MPTRLERAEAETARVTTSTQKARRAERELYRLWSAFRSEPLAIALWQGNAPDEPPKVLVDLAQSGVRVLHQAADGIGASPKAVSVLIRDGDPPVEPTPAPTVGSPPPAEPGPEREPEPVDPADAVEQRIRNLERAGLWDPRR